MKLFTSERRLINKGNNNMNKNKEHLEVHLNLKISNKMFMKIDTIRSLYLLENKTLPSRSEVIRILLEDAITRRDSE